MTKRLWVSTLLLTSLLPQAHSQSLAPAETSPLQATVTIQAATPVGTMQPRRLGGTNIALWNEVPHFQDPLLRQWINELQTGLIRLPGGSWSNAYYWNGHGVRDAEGKVDPSRVGADGYPAVDYSAYAPGFMVDSKTLKPGTGFHGNVDIKTLHDFVKATPGAVALPSLNAGTARAVDAAEWAKWAKTNGYDAAYWHVGNELGGSWEPGTFLPDGSTLTGEMFADRFNSIADAVHKVLPEAKLGSFAFGEDILKLSGERVDFVSIHTYPGSTTLTPQENLANVPGIIGREVAQVRSWIDKYQPKRKGEIEIGYTEWNLSGGMNSSDLFSGLWTSRVLGEFARNGVNFATQWDTFTHTKGMTAGHGLIFTDGTTYTRKAAYYALWLWNHFNGEQVLATEAKPSDDVYSYASRDAQAVYVMLMNPNEDRPAEVTLQLQGFSPAARGEAATLSHQDYFWNPYTSLPEWSQQPRVRPIPTGASFALTLPPFSVTYLRVPSAENPALSPLVQRSAEPPQPSPAPRPTLQFLLPPEIYVGDRILGYLKASAGDSTVPHPFPPASLEAVGKVALDRNKIRLEEGCGRFLFVVEENAPVTLKAAVNGASTEVTITPKSSEPRPKLIWDFQKISPTAEKEFYSTYKLLADLNQRPNKEVARIEIDKESVLPGGQDSERVVFRINNLPPAEQLNRANIRGLFFDLKTLGLELDDPSASLTVAMQSPADYWMVLGQVPLSGNTEWKHHVLSIDRKSYIEAMPSAYSIWFVLNTKKPLSGTLLLDRIGLMVR